MAVEFYRVEDYYSDCEATVSFFGINITRYGECEYWYIKGGKKHHVRVNTKLGFLTDEVAE